MQNATKRITTEQVHRLMAKMAQTMTSDEFLKAIGLSSRRGQVKVSVKNDRNIITLPYTQEEIEDAVRNYIAKKQAFDEESVIVFDNGRNIATLPYTLKEIENAKKSQKSIGDFIPGMTRETTPGIRFPKITFPKPRQFTKSDAVNSIDKTSDALVALRQNITNRLDGVVSDFDGDTVATIPNRVSFGVDESSGFPMESMDDSDIRNHIRKRIENYRSESTKSREAIVVDSLSADDTPTSDRKLNGDFTVSDETRRKSSGFDKAAEDLSKRTKKTITNSIYGAFASRANGFRDVYDIDMKSIYPSMITPQKVRIPISQRINIPSPPELSGSPIRNMLSNWYEGIVSDNPVMRPATSPESIERGRIAETLSKWSR